MYLELTVEDRQRLIELVESRLHEIGSEIRHCRVSKYHDELKESQAALQRLLHRLNESSWDVTC